VQPLPFVRSEALSSSRRASATPVRLAICAAGEIWGGVERFVVTIAKGLMTAGVSPVVMVFHDGPLAERLRDEGITVAVVARHAKYDPRTIRQLRALLREHRINLLHVHGYKASLLGGLAARGLSIKVVKTEHGQLEPFPGWNALWAHAKLAANVVLERVASRWLIDAQVFVSRDIQQRLRYRTADIPLRLIYNGIEPPAVGRDVANHRPGPDGTFNIGIVGRIDKVKGHDVLLSALARLRHLKGLRLHVFGSGPMENDCKRLAHDLALGGVVHFHGFDPAIHERIAGLDLVVIPSLHEGLPYVLLEAMCLKVPVIASKVGGLREVLEQDGCGVLVAANNPVTLAVAIEQLYRNSALRVHLAEKAHTVVRRRFLAGDMVQQYDQLYRQLLEQSA
jgi:glycosyltransferase involved in cell wall biosynthesis